MKIQNVVDDIYRLAVNIEDENYLFEGIWPIPHGISINSYLIKGEKNVLIDLTQNIMDFPRAITEQLEGASLAVEDIDIIIINHMEPDHSGWLNEFCKKNTKGVIYCTKKAIPLLEAFGEVPPERAVAITDGMTLTAGDYELQFFDTPNIHWPETMMTYEKKRGILFSCDAFGSYGKVGNDTIFDDQLSQEKHKFFENEALRYYANIVATFSPFVLKGLSKLASLDIKTICPSHGIIWRDNPSVIINHYKRYAEYSKGPGEREVTLVWSSMYGNTKSMLNLIVQTLNKRQIPVHVFQAPGDDIGYILASAWKSAGLIFGMPTYEYKVFPPMSHVIEELLVKKVTNKKVFRYGSYGWVGGAQRDFEARIEKSGWDLLNFYEWQGAPTEADKQNMIQAVEAYCDELIKFTE
ncbi:NorV [Desulforapulum autotrophicum HRM2]|uniref:NorV n=1 Tax=Desulforapulum autotrophicum (strain ATCC 43914 / DSM 3382 / VKM B-1955 / HRM2) TaxID=177437 RepID=C0QAB9_DESAH|nr:FprA family A-type flavoprotein [Desulforapulum autotrophicum]ACN14704.1 NorV [Desulforapulum autotrophicum HRM2]